LPVLQACAATTPLPHTAAAGLEASTTDAALAEFRKRIAGYMELREEVVDAAGEAEVTRDPAVISAREKVLADRIRARRANARHGDIFTPAIREAIRRLLRPELKGEQGRDIHAKLDDDAPAPGAVPIEVNAKYPAGVPMPTTPAPILLALPTLPAGLEYRIIGTDLILLDQPADVILDYIRNAIPGGEEPTRTSFTSPASAV
jgi:hypothetical protein